MLYPIPPHRLPYEWETIGPVLSPAFEQDDERDTVDLVGLIFDWRVTFWRVTGGYVVTQKVGTTLWILYAGGKGGGLRNMRDLLALIEHKARELKCREVKFEGRDWRRIARGYASHQTADNRWHFRKAL